MARHRVARRVAADSPRAGGGRPMEHHRSIAATRWTIGTRQFAGLLFLPEIWVAGPLAYCIGTSWRERLLLWPALLGAAILFERISVRTTTTVMEYRQGDANDVPLQAPSARAAASSDDRTNSGG